MKDPLLTIPVGAKLYEQKSEDSKVVEQISDARFMTRIDPLLTLPAMRPSTIPPIQDSSKGEAKKETSSASSPFLEDEAKKETSSTSNPFLEEEEAVRKKKR